MKIHLLFPFYFLSFSIHAQFFSGELVYEYQIIAKKKGLDIDSMMTASLGTPKTYLITSQYYKTIYFKDGRTSYSYTYHGDTKRMYDDYVNKDYVTFRDSRKGNTSMIRSIVYKDSVKTVAGHRCFMTERIYENYIQKTYYATDLRIDAESFKDHEVGNWYNEIKLVNGALSLMSITEYATHTEIHYVSKIIPRALKPKDFEIPAKKILVASFEALDKEVDVKPISLASEACFRKKFSEVTSQSKDRYTSYVGFIVSDVGKISHIEPYEQDEFGYYKIAVDIISNCGLEFIPGQIKGENVSSWLYFPVNF